MANTTALVQAFTKYKQKQAEIRQRQKQALKEELTPWSAEVGNTIIELRKRDGLSITDIGDVIGVQNRTLIYDFINTAKSQVPITGTEFTPDHPMQIIRADDEVRREPYHIDYFSGTARVYVYSDNGDDDEVYDVTVVDGVLDIPDEWSEHTKERRDIYKQITAEIRGNLDRLN